MKTETEPSKTSTHEMQATFSMLIMSIASNSLMAMGHSPDPQTGTVERTTPDAQTGTVERTGPDEQTGTVERTGPQEQTGTVERTECCKNLFGQSRRQTKRGFVHHDRARLRHHCAAQRQHLLLTAGQRGGGAVLA